MARKQRPRPPVVPNQIRAGNPQAVHKAYMRLACLELERTRYQREWTIVQARLQALDDRLGAIEAEQRLLQCQTPNQSVPSAEPVAAKDERAPEKKELAPRGAGFSFRY